MKSLGEYIRQLRDDNDLSLREFARRIGRSAAFVSDIELGRRYPSEEVLADIARVLRKSVEELRRHDTRPPVEDLKKLTRSDPMYALAFRTMIDRKVSSKELLDLARKVRKHKPKK